MQGQTVSSYYTVLSAEKLGKEKKLTLKCQVMLMAKQTFKMSFKHCTFIRNDGTVLQKFHVAF